MAAPFGQYRLAAILLASLLSLGGCVLQDISDLELWMQEVLARPGGRIKPLPEIKPYEAYAYQSGGINARDPFVPFYQEIRTAEVEQAADAGLSEEMNREIKHRNREELERFELDSVRMVGTIENSAQQWAIILDPEGLVHRVKPGNYMGRNIGKIISISEDRVELREIVKNAQGRWEERQAAVSLTEQ